MIKATHKAWAAWLFNPYLSWLFKKNFRRLQLHAPTAVSGSGSIFLVANHFSWWDGFFWYYANKHIWKKRFHLMMLEEQLQRFWFFRYLGAFSVRKNNRSMMESLQYATMLLQDPDNLVLIFPQGEIQSQQQEKIQFGSGVQYIIKNAPSHCEVWMGAVFTEYGSYPRPTVFFHAKHANRALETEKQYQEFYQTCRSQLVAF